MFHISEDLSPQLILNLFKYTKYYHPNSRTCWRGSDAACPRPPHRSGRAELPHTITQRFEQHLPYYRIERTYGRLGVPLSRQTLCRWDGMYAGATSPIIEAIGRDVFTGGYVQADETPVKYQDASVEPFDNGRGFSVWESQGKPCNLEAWTRAVELPQCPPLRGDFKFSDIRSIR
jgi:transposase IS66 family protein